MLFYSIFSNNIKSIFIGMYCLLQNFWLFVHGVTNYELNMVGQSAVIINGIHQCCVGHTLYLIKCTRCYCTFLAHNRFLWIYVIYLYISFRATSQALCPSYQCHFASEVTVKDMGRIHLYEQQESEIKWEPCVYFLGHTVASQWPSLVLSQWEKTSHMWRLLSLAENLRSLIA